MGMVMEMEISWPYIMFFVFLCDYKAISLIMNGVLVMAVMVMVMVMVPERGHSE